MKSPNLVIAKQKPEATILDWSLLGQLVRETAGSRTLSTKFAIFSLRTILGLSLTEALEAITDASQDRGIDAVAVDVDGAIHLFQFKYNECEDHVRRQFPARNVDLFISFVTDLLERNVSLLETVNQSLKSKVLEIWDAITAAPDRPIYIHLASNGRKLEPMHGSRLRGSLSKFGVIIHEHNAADLLRRANPRSAEKLRRRLEFLPNRTEFSVEGKRMIVGIVPLAEIARFVSKTGAAEELERELFADNVRGTLGIQNDINKLMIRTMAVPSGAEFVFRNNGITIVADQILYQAGSNFPVDLIGPQIVNGCQTASSAFYVFCKNPDLLKKRGGQAVFVRIIESHDPRFTEDVAISTNSQTRIYGRDLRAIDEVQIKIEKLLRRNGYAYLRKRSDISDLPSCQTIDMARLGQIILAYFLQKPEQAKIRTNDIFGEMYETIFDVQFLTSEKIIAVHALNYMIEERRQLAKQRVASTEKDRYGEHWIVEGGFHVLYVTGLLCERDSLPLWNMKQAASRLNEAIDIVGEFVAKYPNVAAYRLFRTVGTAEALSKSVLGTSRKSKDHPQYDLFED